MQAFRPVTAESPASLYQETGLSGSCYRRKEVSAAARAGRPLPPAPPEPPHSYRTCRDEFCDQEACQVYREGLEDGREDWD